MSSQEYPPVRRGPGPKHLAGGESAWFGQVMFAGYCLLYGGFIVVNALNPALMDRRIGGINLAVVYGLGLIVVAFLLAVAYVWLHRRPGQRGDREPEGQR